MLGLLETFHDEHPAAFGRCESVAPRIERPAGLRRIAIPRCKGSHRAEPAHADFTNTGLGTTRYDHVGGAAPDDFRGFADGLRAAQNDETRLAQRETDPQLCGDLHFLCLLD